MPNLVSSTVMLIASVLTPSGHICVVTGIHRKMFVVVSGFVLVWFVGDVFSCLFFKFVARSWLPYVCKLLYIFRAKRKRDKREADKFAQESCLSVHALKTNDNHNYPIFLYIFNLHTFLHFVPLQSQRTVSSIPISAPRTPPAWEDPANASRATSETVSPAKQEMKTIASQTTVFAIRMLSVRTVVASANWDIWGMGSPAYPILRIVSSIRPSAHRMRDVSIVDVDARRALREILTVPRRMPIVIPLMPRIALLIATYVTRWQRVTRYPVGAIAS